MSFAITFDTLKFASKLKKAGFTQEQAEAQAEAQADVISSLFEDQIATKADVKRLEAKIKETEYKLTIRIGTIIVATVGFFAALPNIIHIFY